MDMILILAALTGVLWIYEGTYKVLLPALRTGTIRGIVRQYHRYEQPFGFWFFFTLQAVFVFLYFVILMYMLYVIINL